MLEMPLEYQVEEILQKLDWNAPVEQQQEGIALAKNQKDLWWFVQPCSPKYNKNVWDNCALIVAQRNQEELTPYFVPLLTWLQDANWPGFFTIFERLRQVDFQKLKPAFCYCIMRAVEQKDEMWLTYLSGFFQEDAVQKSLPERMRLLLLSYYQEFQSFGF